MNSIGFLKRKRTVKKRQRNVPQIVFVLILDSHGDNTRPGCCCRVGGLSAILLNQRGPLEPGLENLCQPTLDILCRDSGLPIRFASGRSDIPEEMAEGFGVLDALTRALTLKGEHAVGGVTDEDGASFVPSRQRVLYPEEGYIRGDS
jgi:hypothetical protein